MSSLWGAIERFLGSVLSGVYGVIPQYGVAIIILTLLVRLVLFPLAVKQIRSMTAMQKIQPKLKEIQKKHKGDRQKLNEEMMKLYREHGVNPLGGCFPLLGQMPAFLALYAVIRSVVAFDVAVEPATLELETKNTICTPAEGENPTTITCDNNGKTQTFTIASGVPIRRVQGETVGKPTYDQLPGYVTRCLLGGGAKKGGELSQFRCESPLGTGHLKENTKLFNAIVDDRATFVGMHLACTPTQATSKNSIKNCTASEGAAGGARMIPYFLLVALMAGTTYYQQRQMLAKQEAGTPQAQQMALMAKIMPVFMGFLSLNFPAALSLYWVVGNFWMIGQQHFILKATGGPEAGSAPVQVKKPKGGSPNGKQTGGKPSGGKPAGKKPGSRPGKPRR